MPAIRSVYTKARHKMNFVPFIDVVFMLLMYFFVAAEISPTEADFRIPLTGYGPGPVKPPETREAARIYLRNVDAEGGRVEVSINNEVIGCSPEAFTVLEGRLKALPKKENTVLVIEGDPQLSIQFVANALDSAAAAHMPSVVFGKPKAGI